MSAQILNQNPQSNKVTRQTKKTPTQVVAENQWRKVQSWDASEAHRLRRALSKVGCYPTGDYTGDKAYDFGYGHARALVHVAIDEMSGPDAEAMARVARLLLLVEREPDLFREITEEIQTFEVQMKAAGVWKTRVRA